MRLLDFIVYGFMASAAFGIVMIVAANIWIAWITRNRKPEDEEPE